MADQDLGEMLQVGSETASLADIAGLNMGDIDEARGSSFPAGVAQFKCEKAELTTRTGDKGKFGLISFDFLCTNVVQLADPKENAETTVGRHLFEQVFIAGGELTAEDMVQRIGFVKAFMSDAGFQASGSLQECLSQFVGHEFVGKVKQRADKNDPDVKYSSLGLGFGFFKVGKAGEGLQTAAA